LTFYYTHVNADERTPDNESAVFFCSKCHICITTRRVTFQPRIYTPWEFWRFTYKKDEGELLSSVACKDQ
jgi:hypothetical protein